MAELRPLPLGVLARRMLRELKEQDACFDLPRRKFFAAGQGRDLSVRFHGKRAATPLGPAAGPHSQMAQNLVLSYLGGCRIMELKTVQIKDELAIPRPCIDMRTVGYNVEWSQELKLEQSLAEYVKGAMLIEILKASGLVPEAEGTGDYVFDMSVGYDLAGIKTDRVQAFIRGMKDCKAVVDELRAELTGEIAPFRDLAFPTHLSNTLTLSTFHGCPPDEIERIIEFLLEENGLHSIVKLNPMLLGPARARELLNGVLGYDDIHTPDTAFERDTRWEQAQGFVERLGKKAAELGLSFGVKFSNTLIVENKLDFFPKTEKEMYLSGPPLFVLAINLVRQFRQRFGDTYPISFSAGIDRENFGDAAAVGLVPITVCSDLLQPGGYGRAPKYLEDLESRMQKAGARDLSEWIIKAYGLGGRALSAACDDAGLEPGDPRRAACETALEAGTSLADAAGSDLFGRWVSRARLLNTEHYVPIATEDTKYKKERNKKPPRKVGSHLQLFDCLTCDKCVPVCPNDANFSFVLPKLELPIVKVSRDGDRWVSRTDGQLVIDKKAQYANFADFCNECGNCDVFCPEDGGPYVVKPRFFGSLADFQLFSTHDGFFLERGEAGDVIHGRIDKREYSQTRRSDGKVVFRGEGFELSFDPADPAATLEGTAEREVDLSYSQILTWMREAVYEGNGVTYVNVGAGGAS